MREWKTYPLGELFEISSGLSKPREEFGFGTPFLSFKEVFNNFFLPEELSELVNASEKEINSCSIKKGDIFLTRTSEELSELGMSSVALKDYPKATFNGFTKRLRAKPNLSFEIDPVFIGYLLRTPRFRKQLVSSAGITTRASLNNSTIEILEISFPDIETQRSAGNILKALDAKISLLHRQNRTLEAMGQVLFKRWFIDFEFPDAQGRPYRSSGGKMVEGEMGEMPEGWGVGKIHKIIEVDYGYPFKSTFFNQEKIGLPLIRIRDLKTGDGSFYTTENFDPRYLINPGDVLAGMDAEFKPYLWSGSEALLNQRVCRFRPKHDFVSRIFIFESLKPHLNFYEKTKSGTTVIHLGKSDIDQFEVVHPPQLILEKFKKATDSVLLKYIRNNHAIQTLTTLRDTLLPKLMSGELRVGEVKKDIS